VPKIKINVAVEEALRAVTEKNSSDLFDSLKKIHDELDAEEIVDPNLAERFLSEIEMIVAHFNQVSSIQNSALRLVWRIYPKKKEIEALLVELIQSSIQPPHGRFKKSGNKCLGQVFRAATLLESPSSLLFEASVEYLKQGAVGRGALRALSFLISHKQLALTDSFFSNKTNSSQIVRSILKLTKDETLKVKSDPTKPWEELERSYDQLCLTRVLIQYDKYFQIQKNTQAEIQYLPEPRMSHKKNTKKYLSIYDPAPGHEESSSDNSILKQVRPGLRQKDVNKFSRQEKQELANEAADHKRGHKRGKKNSISNNS
jgi:hypothetical protein